MENKNNFWVHHSSTRELIPWKITYFSYQCLRQQQTTMNVMQPTKSTISRAIKAARAGSNGSSCTPTNAGYEKKTINYSNYTWG
jgi:hypothetical protein